MEIENQLEQIKKDLRLGKFTSEAAVSQGIVLPTLNALGWPVFDTSIVIPEYSIEGRHVDFALCHPANRPSVFIEVKKVGGSDGADRQLFEYAFHVGVPMAILTDGQEWSFYLPGEQGRYDERRVYKLDLLERDMSEASSRLCRYVSYGGICSGESLKAARSDYKNVARGREIEANLPKAWKSLLEEQDSLLLDLLAEKVEDLCGYKPDSETCGRFLESVQKPAEVEYATSPRRNVSRKRSRTTRTGKQTTSKQQTLDRFSFSFKGKQYQAKSARQVMLRIFKLLAKEDKEFLDRFASRKHGKKRRYLAKDRSELYPGRPDLCEEHAIEVLPGWWLGINYNRRNIQKIINLACEVAGPSIGAALDVNVE